MQRQPIAPKELVLPPFATWESGWFLLTAGENRPHAFNSMTVAWGGLGCMWGKPLAIVVVRPQRYTYGFMEENDNFSLCAFPPAYRNVLNMLGTTSGRDHDKIKESGLTPIPLTRISAPGFDEAQLILECRKSYFDDLKPEHFLANYIAPCYRNDYHRVYFGEVLAVQGSAEYQARQ